ncbi:hypothetical protein PC112_g18174 [Phytophthora cactorum]|nr:hypothetical protein PC112_g18174 [Phytophthora cactorum]
MPTRHEENKLRLLLDDLRAFKSASKKLQSDEKVTLLDVRDLFETLIERHPSDAEYLAANASVVKNPAFENACVKVLLGKEMELTGNNHELLAAFATPVSRQRLFNLKRAWCAWKLRCINNSSDDENTPPNPQDQQAPRRQGRILLQP